MKKNLTEIEGEIDESIIIVGGFSNPLLIIDKTNMCKEIKDMNNSISQLEHSTQQEQNTYILLKYTPQNVCHNRPYPGPQNKVQ